MRENGNAVLLLKIKWAEGVVTLDSVWSRAALLHLIPPFQRAVNMSKQINVLMSGIEGLTKHSSVLSDTLRHMKQKCILYPLQKWLADKFPTRALMDRGWESFKSYFSVFVSFLHSEGLRSQICVTSAAQTFLKVTWDQFLKSLSRLLSFSQPH